MNKLELDEEAIFTIARKIESLESRREYLHQACGQNVDLLERVTALLRGFEQESQFLESPAISVERTFIDPPELETVGSEIGPYKIREQLGEGGMGIVYVADQTEPIRRRVALRVIKPGMDSKEIIRRFQAERQTLAIMSHPNIAKVLDGGTTENGRPYFVMELVKGIPIAEFCDQQKLNMRERLELFTTVCQAVQHAHMKGIIHRDLKPSNVMVELHDVVAVPKVIDFGIAKATNQQLTQQTLYTQFSQLVGTPLYMSPEQAQVSGIDIDTRSDIYSLGVMLYEILTGVTPFDKSTLSSVGVDEMRRVIREDEPLRPSNKLSTLEHQQISTISACRQTIPNDMSLSMKRELDWIVMKALEKDRTRRYESANALSADIQRYLDDEPVQACPPTVAYRLTKYAKRHKVWLTTSAIVVISLLVGTGVSIWKTLEAEDATLAAVSSKDLADKRLRSEAHARKDADKQRKLAEENLNESEIQRERAESNLRLAMDALNAVYLQSVGRERVFGEVDQIESQRKLSDKEKKLLQTGLDFYTQIASQNESNLPVQDYSTNPGESAEIPEVQER